MISLDVAKFLKFVGQNTFPKPRKWGQLRMAYFEFLWTDDIIDHLAEHGVSQDDSEYVFYNHSSKGVSRSSELPAVWGHTPDERYMIAVYEELDEMTILPVTAYEVPEPR